MDSALFKAVGLFAGIGGIALGAVVLIFRDVIRKGIYPTLTKEQAYNLLNRTIVLTFVIGVLGIAAYVVTKGIENRGGDNRNTVSVQTATPTPPTSINTGNVRSGQTPVPITGSPKSNGSVRNKTESTPTPAVAHLSGMVFDESGKVLQGAKVTIDDFPNMQPAETSSSGVFNLTKIPTGSDEHIRIRVRLDGYEEYTEDIVLGADSPRIKLRRIQ